MIRVQALHKTYPRPRGLIEVMRRPFARLDGVHALRGIDMEVERGEIFGLLGPNGAGKTTLQKILVNLVLPSSGSVEVAGQLIDGDMPSVRRQIGYVPSDERSFFWRLTGRQNLRFFAALYEIPSAVAEERIDHYLEFFELGALADQPFAIYSSGRKKLFTVIRGLLSDPPLFVFDEVTNSLDPSAGEKLMTLMRELVREKGRSVVWSTHRLEEVSGFCDRVLLIDEGKSRFYGSTTEFEAIAAEHSEDGDGLRGLVRAFQALVKP